MAEQAIDRLQTYAQDKPTILIADDSRVVRVSLKNILKNDCHLIEAEDGMQAWELLLEHPDVQLIFSDLSMPQLDGRGLLKKIRQSEINRIRNLPFIVVTGNEEDTTIRRELQDAGATEVVNKPFDPASIISFVSTLASKQEEASYFILGEELEQTQFLPGIASQSQFMEAAGKELSFAIRNKNELALALLKIDQFERISKHYSEPAVEHILLTTAEIMRHHIHPDDTMAYFGEGLFAILRPASNAIGTRYIGRRILEDLKARQFYLGESDEAVSASVGISAPEIKHGTRLQELLLLAEGRLKAAMDLGGDRVIDKGNDSLTPVAMPDSSQGLAAHSRTTTPVAESSGMRQGASAEVAPSEAQPDIDPLETARQIAELRAMQELLIQENRGLQEQVDRWRKQSAESEQLRQRVFELESEQQQLQLKYSNLHSENLRLQKQSEQAGQMLEELVASEEERTEALKQANQFYAEENLRLEGQLDAISNRAQKAESANLKSEQLIVSLKDNISLLRGQLEMVQKQLTEAQQRPPVAAPVPAPAKAETEQQSDNLTAETVMLDEDETSSMIFDGFPSSEMARQRKAPVVQMFPPKEPEIKVAMKAAPKVEAVKETFTLPAYRPEEPYKPAREWRPLSSFAIASLILLLMLAMGGGYLYSYLKQDSLPQPASTAAQPPAVNPAPAAKPSPAVSRQQPASERGNVTATPTEPRTGAATYSMDKAESPLSEEAKLQAELTLRQMAEEAFNQQLHQRGDQDLQSSAPTQQATTAASNSDTSATEIGANAAPIVGEIPASSQPTVMEDELQLQNPSQPTDTSTPQ